MSSLLVQKITRSQGWHICIKSGKLWRWNSQTPNPLFGNVINFFFTILTAYIISPLGGEGLRSSNSSVRYLRTSSMMHCGPCFNYHNFSYLVVGSKEFGEVTVMFRFILTPISLLYHGRRRTCFTSVNLRLQLRATPAPELAPLGAPAPLVAPAPEPAVVAPAPRVEPKVNFHICCKSSLAFRFRKLEFSSTFL